MLYTETLYGKSFIKHRSAIIVGLLRGRLSLFDSFLLFLPNKLHPRSKELMLRYENFLVHAAKEEVSTFMKEKYPGVLEKIEGADTLSLVHQIFIQDEYGAREILKNNSVIIDAGANIGTFSIFASLLSPKGKIYAFEPVKKVYATLVRNAGDYSQIIPINKGLGEKEGVYDIRTSSKSPGMNALKDSSLAQKNDRFFDGTESVEITTIDAFVEKEGVPRVDLIKIDTEGYEAKVLEGARKTIAKFTPVITMSAYHNDNDKVHLPKILKGIDGRYVCRNLHRSEEDLVCTVG